MIHVLGLLLSCTIFFAGKKLSDDCISGLNGNQFYAGVATTLVDMVALEILYFLI